MNNNNSSSTTVEKKPPLGGIIGGWDEEFDTEDSFDGDGLTKKPGFIGRGTVVYFNTLTRPAFEVTKSVVQEAPGAFRDLFIEDILGRTDTPVPDIFNDAFKDNPEALDPQVKQQEQAAEGLRVRNFNEQAQKPVIHEIKFAEVAGEITSNDRIVQAAGLSSSFNAINEDGTVDAYTQAVVEEAENIIRNSQKKADMDNKLALATGKGGPDLRQTSINEGGSALSATKSAG